LTDYIETLLRRGLTKKYRKKTGNIKALKGKLEFAGNNAFKSYKKTAWK